MCAKDVHTTQQAAGKGMVNDLYRNRILYKSYKKLIQIVQSWMFELIDKNETVETLRSDYERHRYACNIRHDSDVIGV